MSTWKWVVIGLLLSALAAPAAIADTENPGDMDQQAETGQPESGDDVTTDDAPGEDGAEGADDGAEEEPADDDYASQAPSYQNAAQAMHAANLAAAATLQPDQKTLDAAQNLESAREACDDAKAAWDENPESMELQEAYELAKGELEKARETYAGAVSDLSGVLQEDISQMRQNGYGWGRIAHEIGVHPSALGLARGKKKGMIDPAEGEAIVETSLESAVGSYSDQEELAEATQRDRKNGWSQGHGLKTHKTDSSRQGLGLSTTSEAAAGNSGSKGSKSKGEAVGSSSASAAEKSNNGRGRDGGPSDSGKSSSGGNGKASGKSGDKSNNGKNK